MNKNKNNNESFIFNKKLNLKSLIVILSKGSDN